MPIQLDVSYNDNTTMYYPVPEGQGWKIDTAMRMIVIGHGVPRTMIPLDNVKSIEITRYVLKEDKSTEMQWQTRRINGENIIPSRMCPRCNHETRVHNWIDITKDNEIINCSVEPRAV